jgi:pimeloyl-[acyl-carrier protein] methyl ester esterase
VSVPIILLHGWTMRGAIFDGLVARLGPGFDCHAPDLPGHGAAAHLPPTLEACADTLATALGRWQGQRPLVVGWSMGAAVAWAHVARAGAGGMAGLVTVDMSPRITSAPGWPHGLIGQDAASIAATTRRFATAWGEATHGIAATMFAGPEGAPGLSPQEARQIMLCQDPDAMRALWSDMVAMDARAAVPLVKVPWLVCSGARSRVYPASAADWLAARAPLAARHVFPASGHSPHLEEPQAFAEMLSDFAARVGDEGSGPDVLRLHQ